MSVTADRFTGPTEIVFPNGNVGAMSIKRYESGLDVVAFAVNGCIDNERAEMVLDCEAFAAIEGSRVAVAGVFDIARIRNLSVKIDADNINIYGVQKRIQDFHLAMDRFTDGKMPPNNIRTLNYNMRTLYLATLFRRINPNNHDLIEAFRNYAELFINCEQDHPVVGLMDRYYYKI